MTTREKVERLLDVKRLSLSRLAREIGESKQNVSYWLDKPDSPRDETAWPKIAAKLGVSTSVLLNENESLPEWVTSAPSSTLSRLPVQASLLDMLLEIIESPDEAPERKATAKDTIRTWLKDFIH